MIKKHNMYKPIKVFSSHSLHNRFKSTQPCIELLTCLCIECPFIIWLPTFIIVQNYKIWCRTIQGCRIAPWSAQKICDSVVDVMVCINNESACLWPSLPAARSNAMAQHHTSFVNANIIWAWFFCWIDCLQKLHNVWGSFCIGKFCPCNNNSTWSTNCFNTVKPTWHKVSGILHFRGRLIMRLCTWLCSWLPGQIFSRPS